jgi:ABC-type cobalt transport system substrate-binding protein
VKRTIIIVGLALLFLAWIVASGWLAPDAKWSGVDESVVEKFAKEAGRPPVEPYLNTEQGDLKLFVFLIAGAFGGFIAGYRFRQLFPPGPDRRRDPIT